MCEITGTDYFFIPRSVDYALTKTVFADSRIPASLREYIIEARDLGWTFYVTGQNGGYCQYDSKVITLARRTMLSTIHAKNWMIAHEIAHIHAGFKASHGPIFMSHLQRICPEDSIHLELNYKPRNAARAGIVAIAADI